MSRRPSWWLDVLRIYWPLNHVVARLSGLPVIGPIVMLGTRPLFAKKHFNITYLPVNAAIEPAVSTVLTERIIVELVRKSSHRVIIGRCSCRDSKRCTTYPAEDSCMLVGEDTRLIDPRIARHVSVEEAVAHVRRKIALGLVPMTGRVRMDDLYYGVPNRGRMLTVCFCCPCCCTVLRSARYFPAGLRSSVQRLEGLRIEVDAGRCRRCGTCVASCIMKAVSLSRTGVERDRELCIGCGRCTSACPSGARSVVLDDPDAAVDEIMKRIESRIDVG